MQNTPMPQAIEMVMFKTKQHLNEQEAKITLLSVNPILQTYPGFISRVLSKNTDGFWLDIVYWNSMEEAKDAAQEVMKNETAVKVFDAIESSTIQMFHFTPVDFFSVNQ